MRRPEQPRNATWAEMGWGAPQSIPHLVPDRKEDSETLLYGPKGEPILIRKPRPVGFRRNGT